MSRTYRKILVNKNEFHYFSDTQLKKNKSYFKRIQKEWISKIKYLKNEC